MRSGKQPKNSINVSPAEALSKARKTILKIIKVFTIILFVFLAYNLTLDYQEKQSYLKMENDISELAKRVTDRFGGVHSPSQDSNCYRQSSKFDIGPWKCEYRYKIALFEPVKSMELEEFIQKQSDLVSSGTRHSSGIYADNYLFTLSNNDALFTCSTSSWPDQIKDIYIECSGLSRKDRY